MSGDSLEPIRTGDAADLVDRNPVTIRQWLHNGWIRRVGKRRVARQALVDRGDVLRVDALLHKGQTPPIVGVRARR